jgi:hypothetical protein
MRLQEMQLQRDRALACMILAFCVSLAAFLSVFGKADSLALANARATVAAHESLLRANSAALSLNLEALKAARASLESIERAERR